MKRLILAVIAITLTGCVGSIPLHAFSPYPTADGQEKWRLVTRGFDEVTIQASLESDIGRNHLCPKGWSIVSRAPLPSPKGAEMIDGECKK